MRKHFILILVLISTVNTFSQDLTLKNEVNIFSFKTKKGKIVSLSKDRDNQYIVYRFGTETNIELEYPSEKIDSWKKFKFNSYSRGGGKKNAGMEIYNLMFENKGFQYILFESYHAETDAFEVGIYIIETKKEKHIRIEGNINTQKGGLSEFKYNNLLENEDFGLFD